MISSRMALCVSLAACLAGAVEVPLAEGDVHIKPGETRAFEFGTLPQEGTTVTLRFMARMDLPTLGGSMMFMRMNLNGRPVAASKSRQVMRLVNRPLVSPVAAELPASWCTDGHWRLVYAPDFEMASKAAYYTVNPYEFVLDVTDLSNPAAENRLEITNTVNIKHSYFKDGGGDIVLRQLVIRTEPVPSPTMSAGGAAGEVVLNRGEPGAGPAPYRGRLLPGGGFVLEAGGREWAFASAVSYPDAGLNRLVAGPAPDGTGEAAWAVEVSPSADGGRVRAAGRHYRLEREVRFTPRRVTVADTITNADAAAPLGLLVRHDLDLSVCPEARLRLAGNPDPGLDNEYAPANPSVHIADAAFSLGILCEDTVFRNQARLFVEATPYRAGVRTEMLWLPPGGSRTLEWSVYPVASPDYYDFINLVREDWGSNFTAEGPWTFFSPDQVLATPIETLAQQLDRLGIRYACYCGGWVDRKYDKKRIGFGTGVMDPYWADFRGRLRDAATRLRQARPGLKVLVYYDSQRDTSEGGHERFRDSWLTDREGRQLSTEWNGVYSLTYSVVATLNNSYGKAMLEVAERYLDEMGIDGLYWDEMENVAYGAPLITYNQHDGASCTLNPTTYRIEREIGITTLLGEEHRLAVIDLVRAKGGTLMGNGAPCTRRLLEKRVQRMIEVQHNDTWCYQGNLDTPLGYASWRPDFGNWTRSLGLATLLVGTRYDYTHEISPLVFPFTPIELHQGYLLGQERVIATHDGSYGWRGQAPLVLAHHLDSEGRRRPGDWVTAYRAGECRTAVALADGEAAVLERLDAAVTGDGDAAFRDVVVDNGVLRGSVSGRGQVRLSFGKAAATLDLTAEPKAFALAP
ncbi:MAG: hypothetical protein GX595_15815 [Lentisphaerae bacterium]|nr:hypothetical protein [Lentisphaerota bacterium]